MNQEKKQVRQCESIQHLQLSVINIARGLLRLNHRQSAPLQESASLPQEQSVLLAVKIPLSPPPQPKLLPEQTRLIESNVGKLTQAIEILQQPDQFKKYLKETIESNRSFANELYGYDDKKIRPDVGMIVFMLFGFPGWSGRQELTTTLILEIQKTIPELVLYEQLTADLRTRVRDALIKEIDKKKDQAVKIDKHEQQEDKLKKDEWIRQFKKNGAIEAKKDIDLASQLNNKS